MLFWYNCFTGATNPYARPQAESETDAGDDYENAEAFFKQGDGSDLSDNDYINGDDYEQKSDVDCDYENVEIYANCAV